eukprot:g8214.t1
MENPQVVTDVISMPQIFGSRSHDSVDMQRQPFIIVTINHSQLTVQTMQPTVNDLMEVLNAIAMAIPDRRSRLRTARLGGA